MKFSIRDLLLVTVIVALALGWAVDRTRLRALSRFSEQELREMLWAKNHVSEVGAELEKRGLFLYTSKGKIMILPEIKESPEGKLYVLPENKNILPNSSEPAPNPSNP